ncbi:putative zinc finger protein [Orchesella cincta]|uniref:Putative zinc finger protein n=1 Tax=Orchesella cincta TaxID=48709 RepID=A0A1D2MCU2_ORCCI|nr:putative zinc finger protein [Orchesella cincta]
MIPYVKEKLPKLREKRAKKLFKGISDPDTSRKRKIFKCVLCGVLSKGKHTMRIHLATHHSQLYENLRKSNSIISLDCRECPEAVSFGSEEEIRIHIELVHPDKCSRCPECDKVFLDGASNELDDHIRLEHDGEDDKDDLKMQLKMKSNVTREVTPGSKRKRRKSSSGFKYHCMRCEMKYNELEEISDHVKEEHPQNFWPCAYCKLMKYTERGLLFHSQMCAKRPRIGEEGKRPRASIKGWKERQEEQLVSFDRIPVPCEICEKTICLYSLMKQYSQSYGCPTCRRGSGY